MRARDIHMPQMGGMGDGEARVVLLEMFFRFYAREMKRVFARRGMRNESGRGTNHSRRCLRATLRVRSRRVRFTPA